MSLLDNLDKVHTTEMGAERIRRNLGIDDDPVAYCISRILDEDALFEERGKNYYIISGDCIITVNKSSFTIITAHKS